MGLITPSGSHITPRRVMVIGEYDDFLTQELLL